MKKYLCAIGLMAILFSSCSQEEVLEATPESQTIKVVSLVDGKVQSADVKTVVNSINSMALQFSSEAEYQRVMGELSNMSSDEKIAFTDKLGFVSLEKLLILADAELDNIADEASSEADFRERYADYKEKYSKAFIFNSKQLDDFSAYIPATTNDLFAYIVGENRSVVIGNEVRTISFSNEMRNVDALLYAEETQPVTRTLVGTNSFNITNGSKKTIFTPEIKYERVGAAGTPMVYRMYYHFGAQKKRWYGWKRDSARSFAFTERVNPGSPQGYARTYFPNASGNMNISGGHTVSNIAFVGTVFVWTDQMLDKDANGNIIYDPTPAIGVACSESKAYECKINMSYK